MSTRTTATLALTVCASLALAACGQVDERIELTIVPSPEMLRQVTNMAASLDIVISGADQGKQSYSARTGGVEKLFTDGAERVYFIPRADAQGSLRVDVVVRDALRLPIASGHSEQPLLRGQGSVVRVMVSSPGPCDNEFKDTEEGDVDCGGSCERRCALGRSCVTDKDCGEGGCVRGQCSPAACGNGVTDGDETALDCGGSCPGCLNGEACADGGDCRSAYCTQMGACEACSTSSQCAEGAECAEGLCKAPGMTTRACTVPNGSGTQDFVGNAWAPCKATTCDAAYHLSNALCESDSRTCVINNGSGVQTWNGAGYGPCMATGCAAGQHIESNACTNDVKACAVTNGIGNQTWNGASYGLCLPTSCNSGYHPETTSCIENIRACTISNGMGSQTWNGSGYGTCTPTSCNATYHIEGSSCSPDTRACIVSNGTGSQTWNGSGYSSCVPTQCVVGYQLSGGACVFISTAPTLVSITPSSYPACSCQNFSLVGTNFGPSSVVYLKNRTTMSTATVTLSYDTTTRLYLNGSCGTDTGSAVIATWDAWVGVTNGGALSTTGILPLTITASAPTIVSMSPTSLATGSTFCPSFQLSATNGLCVNAQWEAFATATGGTAAVVLPLTVSAGVPTSGSTSAGGNNCLSLVGVGAGTYYIGVRNTDGGVSNRIAFTVTN